jgi:hypothetical protein
MGLLSKASGITTAEPLEVPTVEELIAQARSEEPPPPPEYEAADGLPGALKNEIIKYCNTYTSVHGIVLSCPESYDEKKEGESFNQQVNRIAAALGSSVSLPSGRALVLFSNTIDRDLLAHRLSKSMESEALAVFIADDVETVVNKIRPFL